ncbi:MAG TPA: DUF4831 family protein [Flavobacterium sp.]|nr:DUF4831 family protein [Flavobacterium sp.]
MKTKLYLILILVITLSSSCYTPKLLSEKVNNDKETKGLVYSLPKTVLQLDIKVKSLTKKIVENGIIRLESPSYTIKSINVTPVLIDDPEATYAFVTDKEKFFFEDNTSLKFNQFGNIQQISSELNDKRPEFIANILKGGASIAKMVLTAGEGDKIGESKTKTIDAIKTKISDAQEKLVIAVEKRDAKEIKALKEQLVEYYSILKSYYENNREENLESELEYSFTVDVPETGYTLPLNTHTGRDGMPEIILAINEKETITSSNRVVLPNGGATGSITTGENTNKAVANNNKTDSSGSLTSQAKKTDAKDSNPYEGLIYRAPKTVVLKIYAKSGEKKFLLFERPVAFPQFGQVTVLPVTAKIFTKKKTAIEFDPSTGSLSQYAVESGASSDAVGKTFASTAEDLRTTITDIKYNIVIDKLKKEKEIKDLTEGLQTNQPTEKDILSNQLEILKLQAEINKLKQQLAEAKK